MIKFSETIAQAKNLFIKNQHFILFSVIVLIVPILISYVPYVNLIYTIDKGILIYLAITLIFIKPSVKLLLITGVILVFSSLLLLLLGFATWAEHVGNVIFLLIVSRILYLTLDYFKKSKQ